MDCILNFDFRKELVENLMIAGLSDDDAHELVKKQYRNAYIEITASFLEQIANHIRNNNCELIPIEKSPIDENTGEYNWFINFSKINGSKDIGEVVKRIECLTSHHTNDAELWCFK